MNLQSFLARVISPLVFLSALAIVWLPSYFVSQDGPSLMYISSWFSFQEQPIHQYLEGNYHLQPNWVAPLLSGFLLNFFDGNTAEKVLATLYLLAFLFGAKALVKILMPITLSEVEGWLLLTPLAIGQAFFKGFYNNNFSVAALLWFLYFYAKYKQNQEAKNLWICGGLMLFMFFSQPLPLLPLFALLGLDFLRRKELRTPILVTALLPLILFAIWVMQTPYETPEWRPFTHQLGDLLKGDFLNSFGQLDQMFAYCFYLILLLLFALLFWQKKMLAILNDSYFFVAVFLLLLYFIFPSNAAGGGLINIRLALLGVLFFVLFLIKNIQPIRALQFVSLGAGLLFLVFSFQLVKTEYKLSREVEDMMVLGADLEAGKKITSSLNTQLIAKLPFNFLNKTPILQHTPFLLSHQQGLVSFDCHFGMVDYYPIAYSSIDYIDLDGSLSDLNSKISSNFLLIWNHPDQFADGYSKKSTLGRWTLYAK
ncbi:MAG: hypothetical protein EXR21_05030 [Flavobacteriaceae bacterium]|nr:hypothetical protein [Flavobacteriaceae bacterium]